MKLLLDTHIWLWSLLEPERLGRRLTRKLNSPDVELWLSPISTWELAILAERGRVKLDREMGRWVTEALTRVPLMEAPLTHEIALESRRLDLGHEDPADRFLVATARVLDLTLVTADERLLTSKSCPVLGNR